MKLILTYKYNVKHCKFILKNKTTDEILPKTTQDKIDQVLRECDNLRKIYFLQCVWFYIFGIVLLIGTTVLTAIYKLPYVIATFIYFTVLSIFQNYCKDKVIKFFETLKEKNVEYSSFNFAMDFFDKRISVLVLCDLVLCFYIYKYSLSFHYNDSADLDSEDEGERDSHKQLNDQEQSSFDIEACCNLKKDSYSIEKGIQYSDRETRLKKLKNHQIKSDPNSGFIEDDNELKKITDRDHDSKVFEENIVVTKKDMYHIEKFGNFWKDKYNPKFDTNKFKTSHRDQVNESDHMSESVFQKLDGYENNIQQIKNVVEDEEKQTERFGIEAKEGKKNYSGQNTHFIKDQSLRNNNVFNPSEIGVKVMGDYFNPSEIGLKVMADEENGNSKRNISEMEIDMNVDLGVGENVRFSNWMNEKIIMDEIEEDDEMPV